MVSIDCQSMCKALSKSHSYHLKSPRRVLREYLLQFESICKALLDFYSEDLKVLRRGLREYFL